MFDKFGEMDTFGEINELAENLFNEGDTASIKTMAKENGIDKEYVEMYLSGDIPVLCDAMTAALGVQHAGKDRCRSGRSETKRNHGGLGRVFAWPVHGK